MEGFERGILNTISEILENKLVMCRTEILFAIEESEGRFMLVKEETAI